MQVGGHVLAGQPVRLGRQRVLEALERLNALRHALVVQRIDQLDWVADSRDDVGVRLELANQLRCLCRVDVADRGFAQPLFAAGAIEQGQVALLVAPVAQVVAGPLDGQVGREVARLLDRAHEHVRVALEVLVERRRPRLGSANDEQVRTATHAGEGSTNKDEWASVTTPSDVAAQSQG